MSDSRKMKTRKLAFSAMLSALGVVILYLGALIEIFDLTTVAVVSLFVFFAVIEMGTPYQYLIYAVTSVLAVLLLPDKVSAIVYLLFGGIYPVFKAMFEKLHYIISWILKFSYFNTVLTLMIAASMYLFHIDDTDIAFNLFTYGLGNFTFLMFDIATSRIVVLYIVKLRTRFGISKYFNGKN